MLIHFGIIPYIVFDGDYLPSKAATEVDRAKRRAESKQKGLELYRLRKTSQAYPELQKAVDVTPEMARQLIDELNKLGVQYVVAPYEADAQLAYLERKGIIQGMLSEDSDLLVFGAKRLLTKLDQYGDCVEISRSDFTACREVSLVGWSDAEFRRMAILSGCDYLASINKMGLKTAYRYVRKYKTIEKILQMLAFDGQYHVPPGYLESFYKAELTFLHQRVFCPEKNNIVMMTELATEAQPEDFSFIGGEVQQDVAIGVAKGALNPMTKKPILVSSAVKTAPKTPWGNPRRNTFSTRSDTKGTESLDSFFKAKRTPLAELDPNSFTPSPTQERLLQQASGASWDSSPAPARAQPLRSNTSMLSSAPHPPLSRSISRTLDDLGATLSRSDSSKRRRLCNVPDDSPEVATGVSSDVERSRFFTVNTADPSPSIGIGSKKYKRNKKTDIAIWSDDSIEDVMAELSEELQDTPTMKGDQVEMFKVDSLKRPEETALTEVQGSAGPGEDSQSSTASKGTEPSEVSTNTQASSVTSSAQSVAQTLDKHVTAELKALTATYSYQPETDSVISQRNEIQSSTNRLKSLSTTQVNPKPHLHRQRSTPLQRLGAGALNRSQSCIAFFNGGLIKFGKAREEDVSRTVLEHKPVLPAASTFGPDATVTKGSEDAIIPDSEDSGDDALSGAVEDEVKPRVDFGRFAFAD